MFFPILVIEYRDLPENFSALVRLKKSAIDPNNCLLDMINS